jgi:Galactose oxidase, central domain
MGTTSVAIQLRLIHKLAIIRGLIGTRAVVLPWLLPSLPLLLLMLLLGADSAHAQAQAGTWSPTGSMSSPRLYYTATRLSNGQVLVAGGYGTEGGPAQASAELYNPVTGTWSPTGSVNATRVTHTATLLPNGKVLVTGGPVTRQPSSMIRRPEHGPSLAA